MTVTEHNRDGTVRIDLHTHSTASDGTDPPATLVARAGQAGLDVVALTDHDTTHGWTGAATHLPPGLTLVRGAELSCASYASGGHRVVLHLLAYLFDPDHPVFVAERRRLRAGRVERARTMVERLAADGYPVAWERVSELAAGGSVGRPHLARALLEAGAVSTVEEAFDWLLNVNGPYYIDKDDIEVAAAITLVRAAGGVPVFAHPLARSRGEVVDDSVIEDLAKVGLVGLEVDHPEHSPADRDHLRALAADLNLLVTG